jgi:hypothetical protein
MKKIGYLMIVTILIGLFTLPTVSLSKPCCCIKFGARIHQTFTN